MRGRPPRYSFLLESVVGGERFGRYSFIGLPASTRITARGGEIDGGDAAATSSATTGDPLAFVERYLKRFNAAPRARPAALLRRRWPATSATTPCATSRRGSRAAPPPKPDALADIPDMLLLLTEELAVVDNLAGKISLIVYADPREPDAYANAARAPGRAAAQAARAGGDPVRDRRANGRRRTANSAKPHSRRRCRSARKDYIAAGDVHAGGDLAAPARAFRSPPLSLYRALRSVNPSPYMFYYDFGDFHVVGASPEILVRKEGRDITLRPIAGTRPRGATRDADEALAQELLADPKERRRARDAGRPRPQRRRPRRGRPARCASPSA